MLQSLSRKPTISGLHDLERIIDHAQFFKYETGIIVNKGDAILIIANALKSIVFQKGAPFLVQFLTIRG